MLQWRAPHLLCARAIPHLLCARAYFRALIDCSAAARRPHSAPRHAAQLRAALPSGDSPAARVRKGAAGLRRQADAPGLVRSPHGKTIRVEAGSGHAGAPTGTHGGYACSPAHGGSACHVDGMHTPNGSLSLAWHEAPDCSSPRPSTAPAARNAAAMPVARLLDGYYSSVGPLLQPSSPAAGERAARRPSLHEHAAFKGAAGATSAQIAIAATPDLLDDEKGRAAALCAADALRRADDDLLDHLTDAAGCAAASSVNWRRGVRRPVAAAHFSTIGDVIFPPEDRHAAPPDWPANASESEGGGGCALGARGGGSCGGGGAERGESAGSDGASGVWGCGGSPPRPRPAYSESGLSERSRRSEGSASRRSLVDEDADRYRGSAGMPRTGTSSHFLPRRRCASLPAGARRASSLGSAAYNIEEPPRYAQSLAHMGTEGMAHVSSTAGQVIFGSADADQGAGKAAEAQRHAPLTPRRAPTSDGDGDDDRPLLCSATPSSAAGGAHPRWAARSPWRTEKRAWRESALAQRLAGADGDGGARLSHSPRSPSRRSVTFGEDVAGGGVVAARGSPCAGASACAAQGASPSSDRAEGAQGSTSQEAAARHQAAMHGAAAAAGGAAEMHSAAAAAGGAAEGGAGSCAGSHGDGVEAVGEEYTGDGLRYHPAFDAKMREYSAQRPCSFPAGLPHVHPPPSRASAHAQQQAARSVDGGGAQSECSASPSHFSQLLCPFEGAHGVPNVAGEVRARAGPQHSRRGRHGGRSAAEPRAARQGAGLPRSAPRPVPLALTRCRTQPCANAPLPVRTQPAHPSAPLLGPRRAAKAV